METTLPNTIEMINRDAENLSVPISCVIELTTKCNWKCKHCYLPDHTSYGLTFGELEPILQNFREMGVHKIIFTGGEIFTRRDTVDILAYSRKLGFDVSILSNASYITNEIAEKLHKIHISSFALTIFSLNAEIHDGITKVAGSLKKALRGAEHLSQNGVRVWVKSPVLKDNMDDIVDVKKYCDKKGYKYTSSACIFPKTNGDTEPVGYSMDLHDLKEHISFIDSTNDFEYRSVSDQYMCRYLLRSFAVTYKGDVTPCNSMFLSVGNLRENTIKEIWNSPEYKEIRELKNRDLEYCSNCEIVQFCDQCPGTKISEGKSVYSCSSISKNIALARHIVYDGGEIDE